MDALKHVLGCEAQAQVIFLPFLVFRAFSKYYEFGAYDV
jgi:hypothetical protein